MRYQGEDQLFDYKAEVARAHDTLNIKADIIRDSVRDEDKREKQESKSTQSCYSKKLQFYFQSVRDQRSWKIYRLQGSTALCPKVAKLLSKRMPTESRSIQVHDSTSTNFSAAPSKLPRAAHQSSRRRNEEQSLKNLDECSDT